jgi:hypothetical protein
MMQRLCLFSFLRFDSLICNHPIVNRETNPSVVRFFHVCIHSARPPSSSLDHPRTPIALPARLLTSLLIRSPTRAARMPSRSLAHQLARPLAPFARSLIHSPTRPLRPAQPLPFAPPQRRRAAPAARGWSRAPSPPAVPLLLTSGPAGQGRRHHKYSRRYSPRYSRSL